MEWKKGICSSIKLEGQFFNEGDIDTLTLEKGSFKESLFVFLKEWWNDEPYIRVHTSGSTGVPKELRVEKLRMMQSARITCSFLDLKQGDRTLLCMPLDYIAGKMVVVRAITWGLDLIPISPSSHPLSDEKTNYLDFAAMVPLQVYNSLQVPEEKKRLISIRHLIIGGGAINADLEESLFNFPNQIWSTYGMTETLSHIALRRLNGREASPYYTPFKGVTLSLSSEDTLVIQAPEVCPETLVTNDRAELISDGRFRIMGRKDNVICCGGVKLQIEEIERLLQIHIQTPFAISWIPDARFGQIVVLLLETSEKRLRPEHLDEIFQSLPSYWIPKHILETSKIPLTETGKLARGKIHELCCCIKEVTE